MLASTAFVACTNDESPVNDTQAVAGKESYLAVNLKTATVLSRAEGGFEDGSLTEGKVNSALFFFFDADKNPYKVEGDNSFKEASIKVKPESENESIEKISNEVVLIRESDKVPPQYILAVLNAPESLKANLSLSQLQEKIGEYNTNEGNFVMTNSVYKHAATGEVVVATELSADNLATTEAGAKEHPVEIYVERVAAKVALTSKDNAPRFNTGVKFGDVDVYAEIEGWNVTNCKNEAFLLKSIDKTWTDAGLGISGWNDAPNFRSYWANTDTDNAPTHPHNWGALNNNAGASNYFYENTDQNAKPQMLVRAKFVKQDGTALSDVIAEWYGHQYTFTDLKVAFANAVKSKIFIKASADATTATSITADYIDFFQASDNVSEVSKGRYLSYATLKFPEGQTKDNTFFVDADFKELTAQQVTEILNQVQPAKIWNAGGYYFFDIEHLDEAYGLVRNHSYHITVNAITGLGTPVYDPEKIITPEKPKDDKSYIAAQVNILAWKVVNQSVTLK